MATSTDRRAAPASPACQAVVLSAGRGTRMRADDAGAAISPEQEAVAAAGRKALMPVAGRTFLDHLLGRLAQAGMERVCVVAAPDDDAIRRHLATRGGDPPRVELALQPVPRGTADALLAAEGFAGTAPFLMVNADNLYDVGDLRRLAASAGPGLLAYDRRRLIDDPESNIEADRIAAFASLELDARGRLRRIVEKPPAAVGAATRWVSLNCWRFTERIFHACRSIELSPRGELEIPAAVAYAIAELGERFEAVPARGPVLDLSRRADVTAVERRLAREPA